MDLTDPVGSHVSLAYGWHRRQAPQTIGNHSTFHDRDISNLEDTGPTEGHAVGWKWAFQIHMAAAVRTEQTVLRGRLDSLYAGKCSPS